MRRHNIFIPLFVMSVMTGCNTIHKIVDIDRGKGLSIDAKQRLVLVTKMGGTSGEERVVCAEPSPDAITATAFALSGSGGTPQAGGAFAASFSEAAASIGLRTQTIQLLRDGYYRLCEAYMNGALSREQYNLALVNIDHLMIPLMAIDAVAGTPRMPAVAISPGVAGTNSSTSLDGGSGNGNGSGSGSLAADASVASTATQLEIETLNASATGLNEHEAKVLTSALGLVEGTSFPVLCASFLSDPGFIKTDMSLEAVANKEKLLTDCTNYLDDFVSGSQATKSQLDTALKKIEEIETELAKAKDDVLHAKNEEVNKAKAEILDLAKTLADRTHLVVERRIIEKAPDDVDPRIVLSEE